MPNKEKNNGKNGVIKAKAGAEANGALGYHWTLASFWIKVIFLVCFCCWCCLFVYFFFRSSKGGNGRIKVWRDSMKRNNKSFHRCLVDTVLSSILLNVRMRLLEGGDYLKYFHQRGAINRGTAIVREIRFSRWSAHASVDILHLLLLSASLFK